MCPKRHPHHLPSFLASVFVFFLLPLSSLSAGTNLAVPPEYGELIYRCNEKSECQVFIIGTSHRDSLTSRNGPNTSKVQAEVYRLGEWLIRNQELELLLPEGFFKKKTANINPEKVEEAPREKKKAEPMDRESLERRLSSRAYVNAEMLLKENYHVRTEQVEDWGFYDAVRNGISKIGATGGSSSEYFVQKAGLDYLQERRTAAMLQNIPAAIGSAYGRGSIKTKRGLFTIGMSHVLPIIKYLNEKRIRIFSPLLASSHTVEDYVAELNLAKENFGVSVIIPRALANDPQVLRLNSLDKIVSDFRMQSSGLSSITGPTVP
jgi:hypothetical protein